MEKSDYAVVGKSLPRVDGMAKATGQALFSSDVSLPGMLYGKILRSPHAHAKILKVDTSKAERIPGVKAVVTGKDTLGRFMSSVRGEEEIFSDKPLLAVEKVRFIGDEVAAVAASDEGIAQEALELIEVEYEVLPAVFDPEKALEPGAPQIASKGNITWEVHQEIGDVEKAFKGSDYVREDVFHTPAVAHCALEPHITLASFEPGEKVTVWSSCSSPYNVRDTLAYLLGLPVSQVRVVSLAVGGMFGCKGGTFSHEAIAVLLARKSGRPVKVELNREEVFIATMVRHPQVLKFKTGVKKDGTLLGVKARVVSDNGAYAHLGGLGITLTVAFLTAPLRVPNLKCDAYQVYTNKTMGGPMRGYGSPQPRFAFNSQLDMIARDLELDPAELMLRNAVRPGETLANQFQITSCGLSECIERAIAQAGWRHTKAETPSHRGVGIGCYSYLTGMNVDPRNCFSAMVKIHEDGAISLLTGAVDIGQGSSTTLAQIVAEEFGVSLSDIRVVAPDTEVTPLEPGSFSSRVTYWTGNAVKAAAADARRQLFQIVADKLEANPEDLMAKNGRVYVKGSPDRGLSMQEAVLAYQLANQGRPIIGRGYYSRPLDQRNVHTAEGNWSNTYSFGAIVAEVEVNRETGQVRVLKLTTAHDCGLAINPMAVEGQIEGAAHMGLGFAISEELIREGGVAMNASFLDYKFPLSLDMPAVDSIIVESIDPEGPFGAKEAGEGLTIAVAPAIANAIYDAVGVRINRLPITPDKVLAALEKSNLAL